jgi:hypothetical protein
MSQIRIPEPIVGGPIRQAIATRRLIDFTVKGLRRIAEPHDYGVKNGAHQLLVYQLRGASRSGKLPDWRLVKLTELSNLRVLDETFAGSRGDETTRRHHWDHLIARVE